jgi:hypothetical protein
MEDFVRRVSVLGIEELEKEVEQYETMCLKYLESYKTCQSDECRCFVRNHIEYYEECIAILKEFLEFKLSNTQ